MRELEIAHAMATAPSEAQGVVSGLCPIHTSYAGGNTNDPLYGYRPAVNAIISRLRNALHHGSVSARTTRRRLTADQRGR